MEGFAGRQVQTKMGRELEKDIIIEVGKSRPNFAQAPSDNPAKQGIQIAERQAHPSCEICGMMFVFSSTNPS